MKLMARKAKADSRTRPTKVALTPMAEKDPLNEFKKPSPHYKFETTPGGQRMLSAPHDSERFLLSFQPYTERAWEIAKEHRLRIGPHSFLGSRFKTLYDLIFFFPKRRCYGRIARGRQKPWTRQKICRVCAGP